MLVFTAITSKHDISLCKLDVSVKNRTAVAGNDHFLKGKSVTLRQALLVKSNVGDQKVCKRKYLSWVYGMDRKICHSESLFGITRQAS